MARSEHDATAVTSGSARLYRWRGATPMLLGGLLAAHGLLGVLEALGAVPAGVGSVLRGWWPVLLIAAGGTWLAGGRRAAGAAIGALGVMLLGMLQLPAALVLPVALIAVGGAVLLVAFTGRRWPAVALLEDIQTRVAGARDQRRLVAVFSDVDAAVDDPAEPVECLALFGEVRLTVPDHVPVAVDQIAIFGDVDAPAPSSAAAGRALPVAATAVFGDVTIRRR